jgi:hypothetical protein
MIEALRSIAGEAMVHPEVDEELYEANVILLGRVAQWEKTRELGGDTGFKTLNALRVLKGLMEARGIPLSDHWLSVDEEDPPRHGIAAELWGMVTF